MKICFLICTLLLTLFSSTSAAEKMQKRTMVFPITFSLGKLYQFRDPDPGHMAAAAYVVGGHGQLFGAARGTVNLVATPDTLVYLSASYDMITKPQVLRQVDANIIDGLSFGSTGIVEDLSPVYQPLAHLTGLRVLDLNATEATDEQIKPLKALVNLAILTCSMCRLNGECFKDMPLPKIRRLELSGSILAPSAYTYISRYQTLETLGIGSCHATDEALVHVAKLKRLSSLTLSRARISTRGLASVAAMPRLAILGLEGTKFSVNELLLGLKGSHLQSLILPTSKYSLQEISRFKRAFPSTQLALPHQVSGENKELFAPLH